jgi:hypothetical protein
MDEYPDSLSEVIDIMTENNIPFHIYNNKNAFMKSDIRKAITIKKEEYHKVDLKRSGVEHRIQMYTTLFDYVFNNERDKYFLDLKENEPSFQVMLNQLETDPETFMDVLKMELEEEFKNPIYRHLFHKLFLVLKKAGVITMGDLSNKISQVDFDSF